jgi:hypothetical protein
MAKASKRRTCPALGREISPADCGEDRNRRIACPAECEFNPFNPANYALLLEIEDRLDHKTMARLADDVDDRAALARETQAALDGESGHAMHAYMVCKIFFDRDAAGLSCAQRWEKVGYAGLRNDERALFAAKTRMRVAALEIRRVVDAQFVEAVDLLAPERGTMRFLDRSLAARATRFATIIAWIFPLPHFWRLSGSAIILPDMGGPAPEEVVAETIRHLGVPEGDEAARQRWLAENFVRIDASILATSEARRQLMLDGIDGEWCEGIYDLAKSAAQLELALRGEAEVGRDQLADTERDAGFTEAWAWFDDSKAKDSTTTPGGRQLLGSVLVAKGRCQIQAMGRARYEELRRRFEAKCGALVRFTGERRQDHVAQLAGAQNKPADTALVPPRLLENPQQVNLATSHIAGPGPGETIEALKRRIMDESLRRFLDDPIPALDGRTPRAAAPDPDLRPKLVRLLKARVRALDEENLRSGRTDDINWLIRELGLSEIDIPAPPQRAVPETESPDGDVFGFEPDDAEDDPDEGAPQWDRGEVVDFPGIEVRRDKRTAPPRRAPGSGTPAHKLTGELSFEEADERIMTAMARFETASQALDELERSGSEVLDDLEALTAELINENEYNVAITLLIPMWFALVPAGAVAPQLDYDRMEEAFDRDFDELKAGGFAGPDELMQFMLRGCPQTALLTHVLAQLTEAAENAPKKIRPRREATAVMALALKAVLGELDRALRE